MRSSRFSCCSDSLSLSTVTAFPQYQLSFRAQVINTYTEAVQTVDAKQAVGKPHTLWVEFAKFYESNNQIPEVGPT